MNINKVWCKVTEKMFYVKQFNRCLYEKSDCSDKEPITDFNVKDLIFLDNTGTKFGSPTNGKIAFLGDILESIHTKLRYEVVYTNGSYALKRNPMLMWFPHIDSSFYVIKGNIYPNPELLK